jgi:tRNA/rRNA methyltransferase
MKPIIILVTPQLGENIGASARAMKNFGLSELRIVSPRDGWPNPKADAMSVGAIDIIQNAKIYTDLSDAIKDIEHLYATTGQTRDMNKNYVQLNSLRQHPIQDSKIGIMFGRENCGLTNQEISYANSILTIETDPQFSSINIAHAVAVIGYTIFNTPQRDDLSNAQKICTQGELEYFFEHLFSELNKRNFFKTPKKEPLMSQNIRNIFTRIDKLSQNEMQTLRGIITCLSDR